MRTLQGRDPETGKCIEVDIDGEFITAVRDSVCEDVPWLAAGFVDLQINGFAGIDLNNDFDEDAVLALTRRLTAEGTTTFLPTVITASYDALIKRLRMIAMARARFPEVRRAVSGIHLEGPWISPVDGFRGAHPLVDVRPPSLEEFDMLHAASDFNIRLVTLSPHWPGSPEFIRGLAARGVAISIGHTHASPEQIHAAADCGASLSTHLGNGIATPLARHPNPIWTQLADDRLTASFIADGSHLTADVLRAMLRAKTVFRSVLVSDSVALAGFMPGEYRSHIGGVVKVQSDGSIVMRDSGLLAGSGICLKDAVARAPRLTGCTLGEAVAMATRLPAAALKLRTGLIAVGQPANLVRFRWTLSDLTLEITDVLVQGKPVRERHSLDGE